MLGVGSCPPQSRTHRTLLTKGRLTCPALFPGPPLGTPSALITHLFPVCSGLVLGVLAVTLTPQ